MAYVLSCEFIVCCKRIYMTCCDQCVCAFSRSSDVIWLCIACAVKYTVEVDCSGVANSPRGTGGYTSPSTLWWRIRASIPLPLAIVSIWSTLEAKSISASSSREAF